MNSIGLVLLYILIGLAKALNYLDIGPRWLRQFKADNRTFY